MSESAGFNRHHNRHHDACVNGVTADFLALASSSLNALSREAFTVGLHVSPQTHHGLRDGVQGNSPPLPLPNSVPVWGRAWTSQLTWASRTQLEIGCG